MRAVAALMVVGHHYFGELISAGETYGNLERFVSLGASGVDIFFVISGFIIYISCESKDFSASRFLINRFSRVVPLYWLITIVYVLVLFLLSPGFRNELYSSGKLISSLFFLSVPLGYKFPYVIPGWTLEFEMAFYLIFAIIAYFFGRIYVGAIIIFLALLAFSVSPLFGEFALGLLAAAIYKNKFVKRFAFFAFFFGLISLISTSLCFEDNFLEIKENRFFYWGVPAFFLVLASASLPHFKFKIGLILGECSYSLYLLHGIVALFFGQILRVTFGVEVPREISLSVSLVFSVLLAILTFRFVETPVQSKCRILLNRYLSN